MFHQILALRNDAEQAAASLGKRAGNAREALNLLYRKPLIAAGDLEQALGITTPTANSLIKALIQRNILVEITGQQRGRLYSFARYLELFFS